MLRYQTLCCDFCQAETAQTIAELVAHVTQSPR